MTIYNDLEERLLRTFNTSPLESLDNIGLDEEEKDKIVFNITSSVSSDLDVDYSDFSNHVFFNSAYVSVNFALSRLLNNYPVTGELKDKNDWRKISTGYENWFLDTYPKQQGYLNLESGSNKTYVYASDYQNLINFSTKSLTVEFAIKPYENVFDKHPVFSCMDLSGNFGFSAHLEKNSGVKNLKFTVKSGTIHELTIPYDPYISSSNFVSFVFDVDASSTIGYINGIKVTSSIVPTSLLVDYNLGSKNVYCGFLKMSATTDYYFSGAVDDLRVWNSARSPELIKRNYFRSIHANHSGALSLYYKFNEPAEYGNKIIDYSGNELNGQLTGTYLYATNITSGTLGSWFRDSGDPILAQQNSRVVNFLTLQRNSGSIFDNSNQNIIYNLVPGFFTDDEEDEQGNQKLFLLLTARHLDRLKLYIQHISNVLKIGITDFNGPPSNLLDLTAKHYGLDIGDVYSNTDALQYFFGENVLSSGSMGSSLETIKEKLKRNILNNLVYILKTKSTQASIKAAIRSVGIDENVVDIIEYSDISGGIQSSFSPKTLERRVLSFTGSTNVLSAPSGVGHRSGSSALYEARVLFNTGSNFLTSTVFYMLDSAGGKLNFGAQAERENLTSSHGKLRLLSLNQDNTTYTSLTSSRQLMYDNTWINVVASRDNLAGSDSIAYDISSIDRNGLIFSQSNTLLTGSLTASVGEFYFGASGTNYFDGWMSEARVWKNTKIQDIPEILNRRRLDWANMEVLNPRTDLDNLVVHFKLSDFSASTAVHNSIFNGTNGVLNFATISAEQAYPGVYLDRFDTSYSYDLNINNNKVRILNKDTFVPSDLNRDIPFVSIDFSPVSALNKEITKYIGDLSDYGNFIGDTVFNYRDQTLDLENIKTIFFQKKIGSKINFSSYRTFIKWFDNNFSYLLSQLIPIDMNYSISNYVIEPHLLEFNKVKYNALAKSSGKSLSLEASSSITRTMTAGQGGANIELADPGRFGSPISTSAGIGVITTGADTSNLDGSGSNFGVNFQNPTQRKIVDISLRENWDNFAPSGYGNGFYSISISGANYYKKVLNVNENFSASLIHYPSDGSINSLYLSSTHGKPTTHFTGAMNGVQDSRWLWDITTPGVQYVIDYGLGYGGGIGQLPFINKRSQIGSVLNSTPFIEVQKIGGKVSFGKVPFSEYVSVKNNDFLKSFVLWPNASSYDGTEIYITTASGTLAGGSGAPSFGPTIPIEGYKTLNIELLGRTNSPFSGTLPGSFKFELKFQFFQKETPGTVGFEAVPYSTIAGSKYTTVNIDKAYELSIPLDSSFLSGTVNFNVSMERELPKQKYMRVFFTPIFTGGGSTWSGGITLIAKTTLSTEESTTLDVLV